MTQPLLKLDELKRAWIDDAESKFNARAFSLGTFTTDDLRHYIDEPPTPNWIGCLAARLRNCGRIREIGRVKSTRPERNGAKVSLWQVV